MNVFVSHLRKDSELADKVAAKLRRRGYGVVTGGSVGPGDSLSAQLEKCDAMIALLPPTSYQSRWVREEVEFGLSHHRFQGRFLPVLIGDGFDDAHTSVPWILKSLDHVRLKGTGSTARNASRIVDRFERMVRPGSAV